MAFSEWGLVDKAASMAAGGGGGDDGSIGVGNGGRRVQELFEQHQLDEFLLPVFNVEHAANLLRTVASILP